ncbi:mediator of RNA polymerase II transcription subunit 31 isoform X2 [Manacus vitellinus]|uniref:mediator of RNA polymerase II transcription subunit 31 isoform X2 n=1 Tax=Manacus vitellinus TaxID=328815 RepID=UPI00115D0DB9|nr:mediator of RNA polymerase II transcription subunit 31 isoform X2 [Manacus vitellinus]
MDADDTGNRLRFQLELEFVQCLANPNYLNFLAQRGYFKDKAFVNYLKYLLYWKEPEYAKYLKFAVSNRAIGEARLSKQECAFANWTGLVSWPDAAVTKSACGMCAG